jgi:signal transduction histidine kinase/CheY-like chemotaxis protein
MNFQDEAEYELVETAPKKTSEEYGSEIVRLDRAILEARSNQSLAAEAIATECTAQVYLEWGKSKIAAIYIQAAYDLYARSGSTINTEKLEQRYPQLLQSILPQRQQLGENSYFTDRFIATLSHEFRNPLNGILGMSEALLEEVFGTMNERQLNAVTTIDRSGGYLLALINNMVDLSKIQVGKLELEITDVSVAELCNFSVTFVKHHAIQKQIQLDTDIPAHAGYIAVDLQRMRQVLINLLERAIDSTPFGGKVKLVATRSPAGTIADATAAIEFSVIDTSKEISAATDDRHKCTPFSFPTNSHRIGLGLMLVNPIVELHDGTVSCQSSIGRGNCVNVSLPSNRSISDATMLSRRCDEKDSPSGQLRQPTDLTALAGILAPEIPEPPLILIVEDNELNINTISSYLAAKGYRPIVATDGQSAIELTQKYHPDLILMDIQMPGMDGIEAISLIRQQSELADIPIVALTALAMEGDREKCLAVGANEYLTKPVKLKQLNTTIQQFLNQ